MGRLGIKVANCKDKENDRRLKEQLINGMNDETITAKIIKELIVLKDASEVRSEQVLVFAERAQKAALENIERQKTLTQ